MLILSFLPARVAFRGMAQEWDFTPGVLEQDVGQPLDAHGRPNGSRAGDVC